MSLSQLAPLTLILLAMLSGVAVAAGPTDFVVQQVCVDAADRPVPGDPVACPKARVLRTGEPIPYRRTDAGNWQALHSYPVAGLAGETRAMAAKIFGGADPTGSFGDLGVRSGYDLLEIGPRFVSGIRTSDPGGGDQIFWRTADCVRTDGWIMFPLGLAPGERGETRSTLRITPGPSTACPPMRDIGANFTTWERPVAPYRYTSGKALDTIESLHFAYGDPANPAHDNDSMEKFYFTRAYGFSRWEAWQTPAGCRARTAKAGQDGEALCRPSPLEACNGANVATFFDKSYIRLDCRDSTFVEPRIEPAFDPLVSAAAPGDVLNRNLLVDGTFVEGDAGWRTTGALRDLPTRETRSNNAVLAIEGGPGALLQDFVVPADMLAPGRLIRWGVTLAAARPSQATLVLTLAPEGVPPVVIARRVSTDGPARAAAFSAVAPAGNGTPMHGRLELRAGDAIAATVDDAYVALLDPPAP